MNSSNFRFSKTTSTIEVLFDTLMNAVDEAVRIDDLTELRQLFRERLNDGVGSLERWLGQHEAEARRFRNSIVTVAVNDAGVDLFGAESAQQLIDHTNDTQDSVNSPDFIGFAAALHSGQPGFTGTFYRHNLSGQLMSGAVETRFIQVEDRVYGCHVIRQTRKVRRLEDQLSKIRQLHSLAVSATDTGCWEMSFVDDAVAMDATCHRLLGYEDGTLPSSPADYRSMVYMDDTQAAIDAANRLERGDLDEYRVELRMLDQQQNWRWFLSHGRSVETLASGHSARMVGTIRLIDVERKTGELLRTEKQGFAMQAADHSLPDTLDFFCTQLDEIFAGARCSINLYDSTTRMIRSGAAPSMPDGFRRLFENIHVDAIRNVCTDALASGQPMLAGNLLDDERYAEMRDHFRSWGVQRCWSVPALTPDGRVVATLCLMSDTYSPAAPDDLPLLENFSRTLAILIHQFQQEAQQRLLEQRVQVQDKFQSLGKLAGGIAQDFNNLLTVISGHGEMLRLQQPENPEAVETTEKILHAVQIATSLCRQMLTFAGRANIQLEAVDMNEVASQVCSLLRPGLPQGITLQTRFSAEPAVLEGDRGMLSQIIMNLVSNAAEAALPPGGRISVSVGIEPIAEPDEQLLTTGELAETDDWVCVTVADNGTGIPDGIRAQIFEPFFTTREAGKGLGLATVLGIIRRHQGTLHIASCPGETVFRVYLPAEARSASVPSTDATSGRQLGRRRILLVDDDRAVRLSLAGMLQAAGYQTVAFSSGDSLLQNAAEIHAGDVILLDQNMPGLKGSETYERLRGQGRDNPVCFVTAVGTEQLREIVDADDACCIVEKPLQLSTISDAIAHISSQVCTG